MRIGVERGRSTKPDIKLGICGEHGGEPPPSRSATGSGSTTSLLAVPRPARPARGGAGRARRDRCAGVRGGGRQSWPTTRSSSTASRVAKVSDSKTPVRAWLAKDREDHQEDDPDAVHVQVLERNHFLSWLTGGKLIDRERFL